MPLTAPRCSGRREPRPGPSSATLLLLSFLRILSGLADGKYLSLFLTLSFLFAHKHTHRHAQGGVRSHITVGNGNNRMRTHKYACTHTVWVVEVVVFVVRVGFGGYEGIAYAHKQRTHNHKTHREVVGGDTVPAVASGREMVVVVGVVVVAVVGIGVVVGASG